MVLLVKRLSQAKSFSHRSNPLFAFDFLPFKSPPSICLVRSHDPRAISRGFPSDRYRAESTWYGWFPHATCWPWEANHVNSQNTIYGFEGTPHTTYRPPNLLVIYARFFSRSNLHRQSTLPDLTAVASPNFFITWNSPPSICLLIRWLSLHPIINWLGRSPSFIYRWPLWYNPSRPSY